MKDEIQVEEKLRELKSDERLAYPDATLEVNAPLALIQLEAKSKIRILEWVLDNISIAP